MHGHLPAGTPRAPAVRCRDRVPPGHGLRDPRGGSLPGQATGRGEHLGRGRRPVAAEEGEITEHILSGQPGAEADPGTVVGEVGIQPVGDLGDGADVVAHLGRLPRERGLTGHRRPQRLAHPRHGGLTPLDRLQDRVGTRVTGHQRLGDPRAIGGRGARAHVGERPQQACRPAPPPLVRGEAGRSPGGPRRSGGGGHARSSPRPSPPPCITGQPSIRSRGWMGQAPRSAGR